MGTITQADARRTATGGSSRPTLVRAETDTCWYVQMTSVLVTYDTGAEQTAKVAEYADARQDRTSSPAKKLVEGVAGFDQRQGITLGLLGIGLAGLAY